MDNELDQRLARMEKALAELREEMERQATQLQRNHGLIVEFIDIVSSTEEPEETPLAPLLERLTGRLEHFISVSEKSAASIDKVAEFFKLQESGASRPKLKDSVSR
jgi:hypothetical protein